MSLPMLKPSRLLPTSQQATKPVPVPAPNAGINRVDGLSEMGPKDAIFLYNMIPSEFGTRVRTGYREWCLDVGDEGRTVIPFNGSVTLEDRLFVASNDGIYDISVSTTSPSPEIVFPIVDDDSGYGQWVNYFNINSDHFALYTDESNGYYVYTETTNLWTKIAMGGGASQISGVDPANFVGVTLYASKVWFVERDTADAWYLATGSYMARLRNSTSAISSPTVELLPLSTTGRLMAARASMIIWLRSQLVEMWSFTKGMTRLMLTISNSRELGSSVPLHSEEELQALLEENSTS